jgi:hypothetical protein
VPGEHLRTLRFVIATTTDSTLRAWALQEKNVVEDELRSLDHEIKQAKEAVERAIESGGNDACAPAIQEACAKLIQAENLKATTKAVGGELKPSFEK